MQQEGGIAAAEASDQVVLVNGDGADCGIGTVLMWRNELEGEAGVLHDLFEAGWSIVV